MDLLIDKIRCSISVFEFNHKLNVMISRAKNPVYGIIIVDDVKIP